MILPIPKDNFSYKGYAVTILRLDKAQPELQGNKYYKLKYNLEAAKQQQHDTLLTFGGAFSNHLHAVALAGEQFGFKTIGVVRGEDDAQNPTLQFVRKKGMTLHFITREMYRNSRSNDDLLQSLHQQFGNFYALPEGGTNNLAVKGCKEMLDGENSYDVLCCPVGTGGTISGLIAANLLNTHIIGFPALKAGTQLQQEIQLLSGNVHSNWELQLNYHFGGYAKYHPDLINFIQQFKTDYQILLDPVYTGKMLYGVFDMMQKQQFKPGSSIACLHTGGLQGWDGWYYRFPNQPKLNN